MITITCQKCLHVGSVPPQFAGKDVTCPKCRTRILVPASQSVQAASPWNVTQPTDDEPDGREPWFYAFAESFAYLWMVICLGMVLVWLLLSIRESDQFRSGPSTPMLLLTAVFYGGGVVFSAAFLLIIVDTGRSFRASAGRAIRRR